MVVPSACYARFCPRQHASPPVSPLSARGGLHRDRALDGVERDVARGQVDLRGLCRHPTATSTHLDATLQADAATRDVNLDGSRLGLDAFQPDRYRVGAARVADDW